VNIQVAWEDGVLRMNQENISTNNYILDQSK
jgi:hypothetical protein